MSSGPLLMRQRAFDPTSGFFCQIESVSTAASRTWRFTNDLSNYKLGTRGKTLRGLCYSLYWNQTAFKEGGLTLWERMHCFLSGGLWAESDVKLTQGQHFFPGFMSWCFGQRLDICFVSYVTNIHKAQESNATSEAAPWFMDYPL